nr:hypothetical protein [Tanacetum cinerariifolium]
MPEAPIEKDDVKSWILLTDGASSPKRSGAGLVLIGPSGIEYTYALRFTFPSTNNEAEYEALLAGLRIARHLNISNIEVKVDSKLKAVVLSKLTSVTFNHLTKEVLIEVVNERSTEGQEVHTVVEEEGDNWMTPIIWCLEEGIWPKDKNEARCLKAIMQGYYWLTMHEDAKKEVEKFDSCQIHALVPRLLKTLITSIMAPWPFYQWGMDILRPLPLARGVAHPQANGLVERANMSLIEGIKTRLRRKRSGWVDELPNVLWAHQTSIKQSNEETPFSLTHGSEAVIPAEIGIPTYQTLMIREEYNEEDMRLNLDLLQKRRETTAIREARYKTKMEQYYNKKVCPSGFRPGEFMF